MNTIYVSDASGYRIRHNSQKDPVITIDNRDYANGEVIAQFNPFKVPNTAQNEVVQKGYLILNNEENKELIKYLNSHPDRGHGFKIVDKLPQSISSSNIITGVIGAPIQNEDAKLIREAMKEESMQTGVQKGIRYQELKQKYYKLDGEIKGNIVTSDPTVIAELKEFDELKKELNL